MIRYLRLTPLWCSAVVGLIAVSVLIGWTFDIDFLKRLVPGYGFMSPVSSIAFILSSVALWLLQSANIQRIRIAQFCAGVVLLTGLIKLCAILDFFDIGIDQRLFGSHLFDYVTGEPNRMAPNTALNFLLMGAAFLLFAARGKSGKFLPAHYPGMFVLLSSFVAIVGYLYGTKSFYLVVSFNPMAIHTAVSFLMLALGLLSSPPRNRLINEIFNPHIGGQTARRLLPLVIVIPLILGWLRLYGEEKGFYTAEMGTAMLVVAIIIIFGSVVLKNARFINNEAFKLIQAQDALSSSGELLRLLSESEKSYRQLADAMPQMVWVTDPAGKIAYFNQRWVEYTGESLESLLNGTAKAFIHEDDIPLYSKLWEKSLQTGENYKVEYRFKRASDNEYRWHLGQAMSVRDHENRIVRWFGTCTDIHEQKNVQEELRVIQEDLERRVEVRTAELKHANLDLENEIAVRRRAEEKLIQLSSIVESSVDAIVSKDLNGVILSWNKGAEHLYGYTAEEVTGKNILLLIPPGLEDEEPQIMERVRRGQGIEYFETVRIRKDGSLTDVSLTISPIKNAAGEITGAAKIARDITERKRVGGELAVSEALLTQFVVHAPAAVAMLDNELRYLQVSERWLKDYNLLGQNIIGKSHYEVFPDVPERWKEIHRRCLAGAVEACDEDPFPRADGTVEWLQWEIQPWRKVDGEIGGAIFFTQVITDRKRVEQALAESTKRERAMIDNALDVICTVDAEGRFVSINPACFKIWGYQPEELIGRYYIDLVAPADIPKTNEVAASIMSGEPVTDFENLYRHKSGTFVNIGWTSYWSESEKSMFAVAHDITERKRAEIELRDFAAKLERSNADLQDFASVASHDLQEPLRKIQTFGDRLRTKCGDSLNTDGHDYLERMQNAAGRMQTLIIDLLTFSRVTTQAQPFVPVNLRRVTNEVLSDLEMRIETTNGTLEIGELATIEADPMQIRQLLQNLIGNALKFHRPGVAPIVKISGQICHHSAAKNEESRASYCLTVEDNGIGFDEKYSDKIFKVFQRLHGRSEYEGTGIGLAVCRKIAERHGGSITVRSIPGEGTIFTIDLPINQQEKL